MISAGKEIVSPSNEGMGLGDLCAACACADPRKDAEEDAREADDADAWELEISPDDDSAVFGPRPGAKPKPRTKKPDDGNSGASASEALAMPVPVMGQKGAPPPGVPPPIPWAARTPGMTGPMGKDA